MSRSEKQILLHADSGAIFADLAIESMRTEFRWPVVEGKNTSELEYPLR